MYTYTHIYTQLYICIYKWIHTYIHVHIDNIYAYQHALMFKCTSVFKYSYTKEAHKI